MTEVDTEAYSAEELILEANSRYEAFLRLMCDFKMLGAFRPNENAANFENECAATFLLMQVHAPSLGAVEIVPVQNSHACALEKGCWKQMRSVPKLIKKETTPQKTNRIAGIGGSAAPPF